ncbi:MAG: NADH-quinone oxidoreductase subunit M [Bifidobacteriaceae bacterium]|jgi:NADH-quinone oxidoreductase subunit M|nr:NADH-quinone oxidoreductase subunit M [Bifidobacteriaceae bacterium]
MMQTFPYLTVLIAAPSVGALAIWLVPGPVRRYVRQIALVWSLAVLAGAVAMATQFQAGGGVQFAERHVWIERFGVSYAVGVNGIGLLLVLLSALLVPVVLLAAWREETSPARQAHYAALVLVLETFMIAVFAARDVFFFYLLFEAMLIPVYFMIGSFGGADRKRAALKFLLYSLAGGLVMLAGVIAVWTEGPGGPDGFMIDSLTGFAWGSETTERLIFLAFFVAFAVKAPMFPVHTWLPDAAQQARPGTSVLLVGVLDKVGTFGMVALCLPLFPGAVAWARWGIVLLAVISIFWGALAALGQSDILRMIAYTSVSHFGFIVLGIFALTETAEVGASFYMINHGLSTGALFLLAGFLIARRGTADMNQMGPGLQRVTPLAAGTFLVVGLSAVALPGLSTFVSEFMVLAGSYQTMPTQAVISALGVILAALYILIAYQKIFTGPPPAAPDPGDAGARVSGRDLNGRELWVVGPLIALMLVLGFYPAPAIDVLRDDARTTVRQATVQAAADAADAAGADDAAGDSEATGDGDATGDADAAGADDAAGAGDATGDGDAAGAGGNGDAESLDGSAEEGAQQ